MKLLEERIRADGQVKSAEILKVDSFLNHQMDVKLFRAMGEEWKRLFDGCGVNKLLTIEASGIGIAAVAGLVFDCPVVFAKKGKSRNLADDVYSTEVMSFTHGGMNTVLVSKDHLRAGDRVLIIDDFLANGAALDGLGPGDGCRFLLILTEKAAKRSAILSLSPLDIRPGRMVLYERRRKPARTTS